VTFTAEEMQRAICQLRRYHRRNWVVHRRSTHGVTFQSEQCPPAEFLGRLQHELERIGRYQRRRRLLRAFTKFAALFCIAGD